MKFADLMDATPGLKQRLEDDGLVTLRGVEALDDAQLTAFAEALSDAEGDKLLAWDFGTIMRMRYDADAANYLFSAERVPLHWDGAFHVEPRYLLFFCDESAGEGGETVFVNTEAVLADAPAEVRAGWEGVTLTYTTEKKAHYGGTFSTPVLRAHPFHGRPVLRFAEVVETEKNPVHLEVAGSDDPAFYQDLAARVTDPRHRVTHAWRPGDVVVVDNHSHLHGREPLGENTGRAFRRIQIM